MRLKALHLTGFKSFAEKTDFRFPEGVTCIVGPNGCGKSNVVDAVKWVLGEQRPTAMRGSEMADVIFGGTQRRKPLGLAEVTLRFDNADHGLDVEWNEVEVTRRLYRDGTSEYLLNRSKCRLRDLRELLMDTGSGPGALTFMEQGRIDQILRESQQERRAVFEEAAGISRYRARRKEALRRLERIEADLLRVSDVVDEKQRLVRSLKIQAGRAERYQALVDEMRARRLELAVYRYGFLVTERETAGARLAELVAHEDAARSAVQEVARTCRVAEDALEAARTATSKKEQEIASLEGRAAAAREKSTFAARLVAELDGKSRWYHDEIAAGSETLERLEGIRAEVADGIDKAGAEQETRRADLEAAEAAARAARDAAAARRADVATLAEKVYASLEEQARLDSRRSRLDARLQGLGDQEQRLARRATGAAEQTSAACERRDHADEVFATADAAATAAARSLAAAEEATAAAEDEAARVRRRESELDREVSALRSRQDVLQALEDRREGVGEGARELLGAGLPGIRGLLADLIEARPDDAAAVETALGPYATAVVVDSFDDAARAVGHLVEHDLGRAVLLPLDSVRAVQVALPADARSLLSAVTCDDEVRPAVAAVLADAVVVADLDAARRVRGTADRVRAVTLGGTEIDAAGGVAGGGRAGGAGVLQRKVELRELSDRLDASIAALEAARVLAAEAGKALDAARRATGAARVAQKEADAELHRARHRSEASHAEVERLERELTGVEEEATEVAEALAAARTKVAAVDELLEGLAADRRADEDARTEASERSTRADEVLRAADATREEARVALASVSERHASLSGRMRGIERELAEIVDGAEDARRELEACARRRQEAQDRVEEAHRDLEQAETDRERCVRELIEMRHLLSAAQGRVEERRGALEGLEADASGVTHEVNTYRLKESEARLRVEGLIERMQEELDIDLHEAWASSRVESAAAGDAERAEDAEGVEENEEKDESAEGGEGEEGTPPVEPEAFDAQAMESEISTLKSRLDRMGPVNLAALAQLESVRVEADQLQAQLDDLTTARTSLLASIEKMDAESRERFIATFDTIRTNFREMFRRLFGGGRADVYLGEGDVLETGVEIVARPPGKELRAISLLSGGERTMTAVALMFAIYMAKPSPFCLLDEVDAALDESNIDRFVGVLSDFAAQSQFIIVSHNKRTMSMADTIFGVTMPERGVSKRVAVHLDQIAHDGQLKAEVA